MFTPVNITAGQASATDPIGAAMASVVNCVVDDAGVVRKRPGLSTYATTGLGSSSFIGLYRFKTNIIGVTADRKVWQLPDVTPTTWVALSDATAATQLDGASRPVFAEDASDLFITGGQSIQVWRGGVGLTARLAAAAPTCTHILNLGQRLMANDLSSASTIRYSDLGDANDASWPALNFATAEARPDPIVALYDNTAQAFLFGGSTLEVWGITTSATAPFQRINTLNLGCSAAYTPVRFDNQFAWLDDTRRFIVSDGSSYNVISQDIKKDLRDLSTITDGFGWREDTDRTNTLCWVFPTAQRAFEYHYLAKRWGERKYYQAPQQVAYPVNSMTYWNTQNLNVVGSSTAAGLYKIDESVRTDLGGTMVAELITGHQDFGTQQTKRSMKTRVVLRRGVVTLGATDSVLEVSVADDGGPWRTFKTATLGQPSDTDQSVDLFFAGCFRRRRYWLRMAGGDDYAIVSLQDDIDDVETESEAA